MKLTVTKTVKQTVEVEVEFPIFLESGGSHEAHSWDNWHRIDESGRMVTVTRWDGYRPSSEKWEIEVDRLSLTDDLGGYLRDTHYERSDRASFLKAKASFDAAAGDAFDPPATS